MELTTRHFGSVNYEQHEALQLIGIRADRLGTSQWLLLADKTHPHLYWLQSLVDPSCAVPVCALAGNDALAAVRVDKSNALPGWNQQTWLIALAEILIGQACISVDFQRPILIDPRTRRGIRLLMRHDQTVQYVLSDNVARLQKCA
jgi:hypothetical protein